MKFLFLSFCFVLIAHFAKAQPVNDDPCGALSLTVSDSATVCTPNAPISWTNATVSSITSNVPVPCSSPLAGPADIWFKIIVPPDGNLYINTSAGTGTNAVTDAVMTLYSAPACNATFTQILCVDDVGANLMPSMNASGLVPGSVVYLRVWAFDQSVTGNIGGICVLDPNPLAGSANGKAVGVGTSYPGANLDVNGSLRIRAGSAAGKILISDAQGLARWENSQYNSAFKAGNASITVTPNTTTQLVFLSVFYDDAGSFNQSNGYFTAPTTGTYHLEANVYWVTSSPLTSNTLLTLGLQESTGQTWYNVMYLPPGANGGLQGISQHVSYDLRLAAGSTVHVIALQSSSQNLNINSRGIFSNSSDFFTTFSGYRLY